MQEFRVYLSQLHKLDVRALGKLMTFNFQTNPASGIQKPIFKQALKASNYRLGQQIVGLAEDRTKFTLIRGDNIPVGVSGNSTQFFTVGLGGSGGIAIPGGFTSGSGIYGSNNGEFGVYSARGVQVQTNVGISGGLQSTIIFGPPSDFAGISGAIGVDIGIGPGCVSGRLIFQLSTYYLLGFSVGIGAGISLLPLNITIEVGETSTRPVFKFR